jgi:hypothetical protein
MKAFGNVEISDTPTFSVTCRHASDNGSRSNLNVLAFYRLKGVKSGSNW